MKLEIDYRRGGGGPSFRSLGIWKNARFGKVHSGGPWSFGNRSNSYATVSKSTWKAYNAIWNGRVSNSFGFENCKNPKKTSKIKIDWHLLFFLNTNNHQICFHTHFFVGKKRLTKSAICIQVSLPVDPTALFCGTVVEESEVLPSKQAPVMLVCTWEGRFSLT